MEKFLLHIWIQCEKLR